MSEGGGAESIHLLSVSENDRKNALLKKVYLKIHQQYKMHFSSELSMEITFREIIQIVNSTPSMYKVYLLVPALVQGELYYTQCRNQFIQGRPSERDKDKDKIQIR